MPATQAVNRTESEQGSVATGVRFSITHRGWYVATVAFLSTAISVGATGYAFGSFVEPLETEFGWTRAQINIGLSLAFISGVAAPLVGSLMDRFGTRPVMTISLLLVSIGFLLRPLIGELWHYYLFSAIVYLGMPGVSVMPAGRLVGVWFPSTRGRMMGLVTAGNNFGGFTTVPLAAGVIAVAGWRWGYVSFGLVALCVALLAFVIVRDRAPLTQAASSTDPIEAGRGGPFAGVSAGEAVRSLRFYLLAAGIAAGSFTYSVVLTQLIPHLENEGFAKGAAAGALTAAAVFGLISKLVFGRLSESITARLAFVVSLGVQATGLLLLIVLGGATVAWVAVAVWGLGFGGMGALIPLTISEAFGLKSFGTILGLVSFTGIVPQLIGPIVAGIMFDATGSYTLAFSIIVGLYLTGAVSLFAARGPREVAQ